MPFHFQISTVMVIWTLTFAALLVLLVVILGRDRIRLYPFFTFNVAVVALRLLVTRLLYGRLSPLALSVVFYSLAVLAALAGILVAVELARRAFAGAGRRAWSIGTLLSLAVAGTIIWLWGPWPAWKTVTAGGALANLRLTELIGDRGDMLAGLLAVELGILVAFFGRRYHARLRSHTQQLVLGLAVAAFSQLVVRAVWQAIAMRASGHIHTQAEYDRVRGFQAMLYNANNIVYIFVLLWWIVCLWNDEPVSESGPNSGSGSDSGAAPAAAASDPEHVDPVAVWDEEGGREAPKSDAP